jgi:cytochrome c556
MNKTTRRWTAGAVLALALCGMTVNVGRGDDDEDELMLKKAIAAASKEVLANLDKVGQPGFEAIAAKIAKEHKIEATMKLFKPVSKGGISIGKLTKAGPKGHKDSIELLIRDYTIMPPTKKEVTDCNDDLLKAARVTAVMAELVPHWAPTKSGAGGKTPEKWKELAAEMKLGAADFVAAAKAKDEKAVETAANRLNNACAMCHKTFRDDK